MACWIDYAPGVRKNIGYWCDEYVGTAVALNNAGLVRLDQLPGRPGMRKTRVTIFPDGTIPAGASGSCSEAKKPGAKSIKRESKNTYMVSVFIPLEEVQSRDNEYQRKNQEWEDRMRALPRPAPLIPLFDGERTSAKVGCRAGKATEKLQESYTENATTGGVGGRETLTKCAQNAHKKT